MSGLHDHDWELPERPPSGHRWLCNGCGRRGAWSGDLSWYGSLKELEDGDDIPTFCSAACRPDTAGLALIRKRIKSDPDFVLNPAESGPSDLAAQPTTSANTRDEQENLPDAGKVRR